MLQLLHIENIAVIESAEIAFDEGFNALTGETGAGKSIVIDAMGAVLGQRTSRDLIRSGEKSALVTALFRDLPQLLVSFRCDVGVIVHIVVGDGGDCHLQCPQLIIPQFDRIPL